MKLQLLVLQQQLAQQAARLDQHRAVLLLGMLVMRPVVVTQVEVRPVVLQRV
jgi:hypothetical protein